MYTDDRNAYRKIFFDTWQKHLKKLPIEPFETEIIAVINMHGAGLAGEIGRP